MKKSLSLVLAVVLVLACALTAVHAEETVSASHPTAKAGETVVVTFTFDGIPDAGAFGLFFDDPDTIPEEIIPTAGAVLIGAPTLNNFTDVDGLVVGYDTEKDGELNLNGDVATLTFDIADDAAAGDYVVVIYYSIEVEGGDRHIADTLDVVITVEGDEPEPSSEEPSSEEPSSEEPSSEEPSSEEPSEEPSEEEPAEPTVIVADYEIEAGEEVEIEVEFAGFAEDAAYAIKYAFDDTAFEFVSAEWKLDDAIVEASDSPAVIAFDDPIDANGLVFVLTLKALDDAEGDYDVDFEAYAEADKENSVEATATVTVNAVEEPTEIEIAVVPFRAYILDDAGGELYDDTLCSDVNGANVIGNLDPDTEYYITKLFDNGAVEVTTNDDRETVLGYAFIGAFVHESEDDGELEEIVAEDAFTSYIRPNGAEYGGTDPDDVCYIVYNDGEFVQAFYPVGDCYKLGWFDADDFYGEEEPSSEEPSSEEPSVEPSSEEPSNPPTPPQGDAGLIALAIVSAVTLAGVVVVKKSK